MSSASTDSSPAASAVPPASPQPPPRAQVLAGWKKCLALLAGLLIRVWTASLRIRVSDTTLRLASETSRPALFVLWHNRLFVAATISRRFRAHRPLHCLVSASKDGAWLVALFASMGLRAVRGSSSKGGREAASELVRVLREG
ncbi:MAG: DUF374 domain-containing protein, partial [Burkholderiales bacterium]|nr:DUF374 domain-containing protein [Opitutaceae bacterium]